MRVVPTLATPNIVHPLGPASTEESRHAPILFRPLSLSIVRKHYKGRQEKVGEEENLQDFRDYDSLHDPKRARGLWDSYKTDGQGKYAMSAINKLWASCLC